MSKKRTVISIGIIFSLFLTGCSRETEIPELIDPVVNNQSFRPVERGNVGNTVVKIADVVPEEYCHFMRQSTKILEIFVDIGQYVEEGTILAATDMTEWEEALKQKKAELSLQNTLSENNEKIIQEQLKVLNLKRKACKKQGDISGAKEYDTQIAIAKENERYDKLLAEHNLTALREEIAELEKSIEEGTIRAGHAGYVTYVKDLSETDTVNSMENIVIISDYDELHLELEDSLLSDFYRQDINRYDRIYTEIGGTKYTVEPFSYTNAQMLAIQSAELYPRIRLEAEGITSGIQPGDKLPVYFVQAQKQNVLKIGTDSLYNEGDSYFVYVRNDAAKEKREIQIGYKNDLEVEVTDGLKEGEWVFYSSDAIMPNVYEEYAVEEQVYSMETDELGLRGQTVYTKLYAYTQAEAATVEALYFAAGDKVTRGDLICVLDTKTGSAKLEEQKQAIRNLKADYTKSRKEYNAQIAGLEKQIKQLRKKITTEALTEDSNNQGTEQEAVTEEKNGQSTEQNAGEKADTESGNDQKPQEAAASAEQLICEKRILIYQRDNLAAQYIYDSQVLQVEYDKLAAGNDGHGKVEIYANQDGILGNVSIYEGKEINPEKDENLFQIYDVASRKLMVNIKEDYVGVGNEVTFYPGGDKTRQYTGKIIGNSAVADKVYLSGEGDKIYVTQSYSFVEGNKIFIAVEDAKWGEMAETAEVFYSKARLQNAVVLPSTMVNKEVNKWKSNVTFYYVWKVVEDVLVKQYVTTDESLNTLTQTCILDGLSEGDIVVRQVVEK